MNPTATPTFPVHGLEQTPTGYRRVRRILVDDIQITRITGDKQQVEVTAQQLADEGEHVRVKYEARLGWHVVVYP